MSNPTQIEAISRFLIQNTHQDLAKLYNEQMEIQVIVQQKHGQRVEQEFKGRQWHAYTDGVQIWYPIRIPKNANNNPEYDLNKIMSYDLSEYVEGIGLTGWNWIQKKSIYVGFDFDALVGHSDKHSKRLSSEELNEITDKLMKIPYCEIRKSTSGKGLHLYIHIDPDLNIITNNHNEHAALARAILGQLSAEVNFDFSTKVDTCGHILWIYHNKMKGTDGLNLIKKGLYLHYVPSNWKDHIQVISGRRNKTIPNQIYETQEDTFDLITGQRNKIKLDKDHHRVLDYLRTLKYSSYWDAERWMLVTHSYALKLAHDALGLIGKYQTISEGTDPNQNSFAFPLPNGGWVVRRFSPGVAEAPTWEQDLSGYTKCYFNTNPNIHTASKSNGGMENKSGAFIFNEVENIINACKDLGIDLELPNRVLERKARMKHNTTNNKLIVEIEHNPNKDSALEMDGWFQEGKWWTKIFQLKQQFNKESEIYNYDDTIRHVISEDGKDLGWYTKTDNLWHSEPLIHIKSILEGPYGYSPKEAKIVLGTNIIKPWIIVNRPFQTEYPGERLWNKDSAQFRFAPSDIDNPTYPTWSKILNHLGENLNSACQDNAWCKKNGILTGADYLLIWVASIFQQPYEPLPYLFFYGPENTGKSIFHEALSLLITNGYVRADSTLKSSSNFNGELFGSIICVVEEIHLKRDKNAAAKIKDFTTAVQLPIHAKGKTPYLTLNTTHWVQCVPHNTWILTSEGPRQVKDLINKDFVAIVDGRKYKANGFTRTGYKEVFEIETIEGHTLQCTSNHKVLTQYLDLIDMWQEVSNLKEGNIIHLHNHSNIEWNGKGNFDEGYILGLLIGDGSFSNKKEEERANDPVLLFYTDEDKKLIPYVTSVLNNYTTRIRSSDGTIEIKGSSLKDLCEHFGINDKDIEILENTSSDFYCGFLSGFFDTDGSSITNRKQLHLYQSNLNRLKVVQRMLLRLGIISKIYSAQKEKINIIRGKEIYSKDAYQLYILGKENLQRFQNKIDFKLEYKSINLEIAIKSWQKQEQKVKYKATIKSIKSIGFKSVYDTQVETVHVFDANGFMVHNCSNDFDAAPIFEGDSRITMIQVGPLKDEIPKREIKRLLEKESPDFLCKIKNLELPHPIGRLGIPILNTEDKKSLQQSNRTPLEAFLEEHCFYAPGKSIPYNELYQQFKADLDPQETIFWSIRMMGKQLPPCFPKGRLHGTNPNWVIGNISLTRPTEEELKERKYILNGQYLILEATNNSEVMNHG